MAVRVSKAQLKFHFSLTFRSKPKGWQTATYVDEVQASDRDEAVELINRMVQKKRNEGLWLEDIVSAQIVASSHDFQK